MPRQNRPKSSGSKPQPSVPATAKRERKKRESQGNADQPQATFHDPNTTQIKWATVVIAVATCVMVAVSALQWIELRRSLEADQRPWLTIAAKPASRMVFFVEEDGLLVVIDYEIKNVGKTPATNVLFRAATYHKWEARSVVEAHEEISKLCVSGSNVGRYTLGYVILPGETFRHKEAVHLSRAVVREAMDKREAIKPSIVACVAYTIGYTGPIHRTVIVSTLSRKYDWSTTSTFPFQPDKGSVPLSDLSLNRKWSYTGAYAD